MHNGFDIDFTTGIYDYAYHPTTGQLASITAPGGELLEYTYDGSLLTTTEFTGTVNALVTRGYDNDFAVTSRTVNGQVITFAYDNDKLLTQAGDLSITRNAATGFIGSTTLGSVTTSLGYNVFGELSSDSANYGATSLYSASFTRDKLGRITSKTEVVQSVTTVYDYEYDAAGRLDRVFVNGALSSDYSYDLNGNRLEKVGTAGTEAGGYDDQDRLLSYGDYSYTYDANGNLTTRTHTPTGDVEQYSYDELGNLRSVVLANGDLIEYVIDGQNRRIAKKLNGGVQYGLVYKDQLEPVVMVDAAGAVLQRYVYGTKSHVPDYVLAGGVKYRIVSDHLGSVRMVVNSSTGAVVQRMDYDEFGRVLADSSPGWQPFGYAGGIVDGDTGLVRFGARDYDAQIGRWTAKDPVRFDGGENHFVYVKGDPINFVDSNGENLVAMAWLVRAEVLCTALDFADAYLSFGQIEEYRKELENLEFQLDRLDQMQSEPSCSLEKAAKIYERRKELLGRVSEVTAKKSAESTALGNFVSAVALVCPSVVDALK